ncbi:MAG: pyruvate synthase [Eubacterium sp.]|nr:pyruvate synthase [Eubacterium sp.]
MYNQKSVFKSANEAAAISAKQINYHLMGYYPITPSTQIAEDMDLMKSKGDLDTVMIAAEGEHSAAGICYGGSLAGGRVINATSANGLLYALEQLPVQSGTRVPMVMNVACRTVSAPLCIKGDHSDIMFALNTGWIILFAKDNQEVYDFNIIGLKVAEKVKLPVIIAYDGFFTSHQKKNMKIFEDDNAVKDYIGEYKAEYTAIDVNNPVTIGSYMNEPDIINNKYQLRLAMEDAKKEINNEFEAYYKLSGRNYNIINKYLSEDADVIFIVLGSAFDTARVAVDNMRNKGIKVGAITLRALRPFFHKEIANACKNAKVVVIGDRQDSYGEGGNLSTEIKSAFYENNIKPNVITRVFGLGGKEFYVEDAEYMLNLGINSFSSNVKSFDYYGIYKGSEYKTIKYFEPVTEVNSSMDYDVTDNNGFVTVKNINIKKATNMPKRLVAGHSACSGCGIPVNINLLLKGIEGNVVMLFHTGCGMVVTTGYPTTAFNINYVHNLFQNGAATLSGILETYKERQRRGEIPQGKITFIMVSGDGGMDIGLGSALAAATRNHNMIIFEYDNGGYMNTGYQYSYTTPLGAKSATSHIGIVERGKPYLPKDTPKLFSATGINYIATVAESNPQDFIVKAKKAQYYADNYGLAYIKAISACPLNWQDEPKYERDVIRKAVDSCYFPLYEIERGITKVSYKPKNKIEVIEFLKAVGRTKHLAKEKYNDIVNIIQKHVDKKWNELNNQI